MNTKASVAYGWAALTVGCLGGAYVGFRQWQGSFLRARLCAREPALFVRDHDGSSRASIGVQFPRRPRSTAGRPARAESEPATGIRRNIRPLASRKESSGGGGSKDTARGTATSSGGIGITGGAFTE